MMHPRSPGWLLLTLAALAALLGAELHFQVGAGAGGQSIQGGSAPAGASPAPLFTLATRESFSETLARPLFMPNREPPEAVPESPLAAPRAARPKANRYVLSAIIIVGNEPIALLTDTTTGSLSRVRQGDSLAGWRVEEIRADGAVLSNGDTREELILRTFGMPAPAPRSTRRRAGATPTPPSAGGDGQALPNRPRRPKRGPRQSLPTPSASKE